MRQSKPVLFLTTERINELWNLAIKRAWVERMPESLVFARLIESEVREQYADKD